jgi:hypothetical protein
VWSKGIAMTDIIEIAKKRRDGLVSEIGKLDNFVGMAEMLVQNGESYAEDGDDSATLNLFADSKAQH